MDPYFNLLGTHAVVHYIDTVDTCTICIPPQKVTPGRKQIIEEDTDVSGFAVDGVLSQVQNGMEIVITYGSKSFTKSKKQWCTTCRELSQMDHWLYYLKPFSIVLPNYMVPQMPSLL